MIDVEISLEGLCSFCWKGRKKASCNEKACCLIGVYNRIKNPRIADIIRECCVQRCKHDPRYHEKYCPISLAGVNKEYPLNPKIKEILKCA